MNSWIVILSLLALFVAPAFSAEEMGLSAMEKAFKEETSIPELIRSEVSRLDWLFPEDTEIKLPEKSELGKKIREFLKEKKQEEAKDEKRSLKEKREKKPKGELTLKEVKDFLSLDKKKLKQREWKELLAVLRANNRMLKTGRDLESTLKDLSMEELLGIAANTPGQTGRVKVNNSELRDALNQMSEKLLGKKIFFESGPKELLGTAPASELAKLLAVIPPPKEFKKTFPDLVPLKDKDFANLLGDVRSQSPEVRGFNFWDEFDRDAFEDRLFVVARDKAQSYVPQKSEPYWANIPLPEPGAVPQRQRIILPPGGFGGGGGFQGTVPVQPGADVGGGVGPGPSGHGAGPGITPGQSSGRSVDPGPSQSGRAGNGGRRAQAGDGQQGVLVPQGFFRNKPLVTSREAPEILSQLGEDKLSLRMETKTFGNGVVNTGFCQLTVVKKEKSGDQCHYAAATARHCLDKPFDQISIKNINNIVHVSGDAPKSGEDVAILRITSQGECADDSLVPEVPISASDANEGEAILVAGRRNLVGRASQREVPPGMDSQGLTGMDVRQEYNGGLGIYQGDSGGGVARFNPETGRFELVGVVSSKLEGEDYHGLAFMAAKSSLDWLREEVEGSTADPQLIAQTTKPARDRAIHQ